MQTGMFSSFFKFVKIIADSKILFFFQVFARIAPSLKLKTFKDSLRLFMHHFLIAGAKKSGIDDDRLVLLRKRIQIADKSLETIGSKIQF